MILPENKLATPPLIIGIVGKIQYALEIIESNPKTKIFLVSRLSILIIPNACDSIVKIKKTIPKESAKAGLANPDEPRSKTKINKPAQIFFWVVKVQKIKYTVFQFAAGSSITLF